MAAAGLVLLALYAVQTPGAVLSAPRLDNPPPEAAGPSRGLGCYFDSAADRLLDGPFTVSDGMTIEVCKDFCAGEGAFPAYGLESGKECYCGAVPSGVAQIDGGTCDMPCGGDNTEACGGPNAIYVFEVSSSS